MLCVSTHCRTSLCSRLYFPPFFKATLWIPSIARSIDCSTSSCSGVCQRHQNTPRQKKKNVFIRNLLENNTTEPWLRDTNSFRQEQTGPKKKKKHFNQRQTLSAASLILHSRCDEQESIPRLSLLFHSLQAATSW